MKFYLVKCKFGHVGRDKYLPINIPVIALNSKEASYKARLVPGVKKDHKDWCLKEPTEITIEEYSISLMDFKNDIYFEKKTRSRLHLFEHRLKNEANYTRLRGYRTNKPRYLYSRNLDVVNYKIRKNKEINKSYSRDLNYYREIYGGINQWS